MSNEIRNETHGVLAGFPQPRLEPFLRAAEGDEAKALDLYVWNTQMAGAALEQISHLEILLRHAIDTQLSKRVREDTRKIPWFLLPPFYSAQSQAIDKVRERLRSEGKETRDQIVAGLSFGFWSGWMGAKHEELWRETLHNAFPGAGLRKDVTVLAEQIRKVRNRVAHHDSLLNIDVGFEMRAVFSLAEMINKDAADWMRTVDRTRDMGIKKPISPLDTVVVPSAQAKLDDGPLNAYICQPGRFFQEVGHMAFYEGREIAVDVPCIKARYDNVLWNETEADRLKLSEKKEDKKLGKVMASSLEKGWSPGKYQVFLLSRAGDPDHVALEKPLQNDRAGKGSAFVNKQRYTSVHRLRHAENVWDL